MTGLEHLTAVILAGGRGTRLREVVSDRPKVLADVNGRPFLTYILDRLATNGISRVVLCTGYMAELIKDELGDSYRGMSLDYSREETPLGTAGALRHALPLIASDPVLVMNGDSFCDADLTHFVNRHYSSAAKASLVLTRVADVARYGAVDTNAAGAVAGFREKGKQRGKGMINAGIYLLSRSVITALPEGINISLEREVFPMLIGQGLYGFFQPSRFIDIGIPSDYRASSAFFALA